MTFTVPGSASPSQMWRSGILSPGRSRSLLDLLPRAYTRFKRAEDKITRKEPVSTESRTPRQPQADGALAVKQLALLGCLHELGHGGGHGLHHALRRGDRVGDEAAARAGVNVSVPVGHALDVDGHVQLAVPAGDELHGLLDRVCAGCHRFASLGSALAGP